ncbi:BRCA1-A complex subunit Abraxas 1-like isoform X2 [Syngnathus acus]|uniref:BRCA1-A complex subunit Abraxas 1-like isoform X2 n=1 Tax=Syngnathus acus TaxID=161584 RepID=UPI001885D0AE|nr:BRCA1-A complex subunit Abraxas 1-like isoform X2 [Syngnathus acus]
MAEPSVRIPGIVLSSLLFEHINKDSDVEGLILGENHVEEHVTISDTQEDHVHLRRTSSVHKHVCCHKLDTWYDAAGRVDEEAVGRLLGGNHRDLLIGWYRQRRNSERRMTMREKAVHENFRAALRVPHAVFLLVTPAPLAEAGSTHRAEYSAFVSGNRQVPVVVTNLASLDHRAYWTASPPCRTPGYRRAIGRHSSTLLDASGRAADAEAVNGMNESLQDELRRACGAVADSERAVQKTLTEVCALRKKLGDSESAAASKEGVAVATRNLRLRLAIGALVAHSPLFGSCTLTRDAFPVLEAACDEMKRRPVAAAKRSAKRKRRHKVMSRKTAPSAVV